VLEITRAHRVEVLSRRAPVTHTEVKTTHRIPTLWAGVTCHVLFDKRGPKLFQQEAYKGAETIIGQNSVRKL
jgi:hypothetical protein